jgi:hypothetical protein
MNTEVAKLWLNGASIGTTQNNLGVRPDTRTYTFFVNMRDVLGETLFSKYEAFKCFITPINIGNSGQQVPVTLYQNGLNLINASYQGNVPGYNTAVGAYNLTQLTSNPLYLYVTQNTREFVLIKPNDQKIPLTLSVVNDNGATSSISIMMFQLDFTPMPVNPEKIYKNPFNQLYQNEQVNFTLSTQLLTAGGTNQYGTANANLTNFTFTNVNMRRIIGTLWDKYDKFNLVWNSVGLGQTAASISGANRQLFWVVTGLQFINTIAMKSGVTNGLGWSPVFYFNAASTADANIFDSPSNMISFRKPESENVDLNFELWTALNGTTLSVAMNNSTMTFSVVGIPKE